MLFRSLLYQTTVCAVAIVLVTIHGGNNLYAADNTDAVAREAFAFLNKYCTECHHGDKPVVKDYDVVDYASLTKKRVKNNKEYYLVRSDLKGEEALKASRIWRRAGVKDQLGAEGDMPDDDAKLKPTDRERSDVLRKWIEAGAPAWPKEGAAQTAPLTPATPEINAQATNGELWFEVRGIFERRCMKCHDGSAPQSGVTELQIMDYQSLTRKRPQNERKDRIADWPGNTWSYVKPGAPSDALLDESLLYDLIKRDKMPRGSEKLSPGEKAIVKTWVASGAPIPPAPAARAFLSRDAQHAAILKHLNSLPAGDRPFQRYFSFTHLHNNANLYEQDLKLSRAGLSKLINSLSWETKLVVPRAVPETFDAVFSIDLRSLGWDKRDLWESIVRAYPYSFTANPAETDALKAVTGTQIPCVRADWFVTIASRPPLYHAILDLPNTSQLLEKKLGIDFQRNFKDGNLARAGYLGASTTTSGFRVVERQEIPGTDRAYWKSYDFGSTELALDDPRRHNPLLYCMGPAFEGNPFNDKAFLHDGSEIIFNLPNGMQAYLVVDAEGRRMDKPPVAILKDKNEFSGTPQLVNGISCMACHSQGMQTVSDQVNTQGDAGDKISRLNNSESKEQIHKIYIEKEKMDSYLKADEKRFLDAVNGTTKRFLEEGGTPMQAPKIETIYGVTARFRQNLQLDDVAAELGFEKTSMLREMLLNEPKLIRGLGIQTRLMQDGGKISREEWTTAFEATVVRLKLGHLVVPKVHNFRESNIDK